MVSNFKDNPCGNALESERLTHLIGKIYDAALEPDLWPQTLDATRQFVNGFAANMFWQNLANNDAGMSYAVGDDPAYRQTYIEEYATLNPLYPAAAFVECGTVFNSTDLLPFDEMTETRFYNEWQKPQGIIDGLLVNLEKTDTVIATLAVLRNREQGLADENFRRRMRLIVPHAMRAISIGQLIGKMKCASAANDALLSRLTAGVVLIDQCARIVFANEAAKTMLRDATLLHNTRGALTAVDTTADCALRDAITAAGSGDAALGIKGVAVPLTRPGGERWLAHVLPLTSGARRVGNLGSLATAAVFVRKAGLDIPSALESVSELYALTASELRVLAAITEIGGVPAVAGALGISVTTVRTHLDSLFAKTGARRQADLVKLMAGAASPF